MEHIIEILKSGGTILYPTDTIWGIGCDATNIESVNKIFDIKKLEKNKSLATFTTIICNIRLPSLKSPNNSFTALKPKDCCV